MILGFICKFRNKKIISIFSSLLNNEIFTEGTAQENEIKFSTLQKRTSFNCTWHNFKKCKEYIGGPTDLT